MLVDYNGNSIAVYLDDHQITMDEVNYAFSLAAQSFDTRESHIANNANSLTFQTYVNSRVIMGQVNSPEMFFNFVAKSDSPDYIVGTILS
jgi:hypothetical protein